jgi:hypothetical protein
MNDSVMATELSIEDQKAFEEMERETSGPPPSVESPPPSSSSETAPSSESAPDDVETLRRERDEARSNYGTLESRTNQLFQHLQGAAAQAEQQRQMRAAVPDPGADPVGHIVGKLQLLEQREVARQQGEQHLVQLHQQTQAVGGLISRAQELEREFQDATPDYPAAIEHLVSARDRELELLGFSDPAMRKQQIQREGLDQGARDLRAGKNPAATLYELARARGFDAGRAQRGQATEQRLQRLSAGHQQARSLGSVSGSGPRALTPQRALEMSDNDYAKLMESPEGLALLGA